MTIWHEDDNFWDALGPVLFSEEYWKRAPEEIEKLISLLEIKPNAYILDLCCGPGRHSLELARKGFKVLGVDRTLKYLNSARKKAEKQKLNIEFLQDDMRKFCRKNTFDVIINFYTSFGYFKDKNDDKQVLKNMYISLKTGGKAIIDVIGKEVLAKIFQERHWEERDGILLIQEGKLSSGWDWINNRWILIDGNERKEFTLSHRLYSGAELSSLLYEVGFKSVETFGDLDGNPYDHRAKRLITTAIK